MSHTWRGYGSAIFLELGKLKHSRGENPRGEAEVMIEWSWRIEGARSVLLGSWSLERKITNGVRALMKRRVTDLTLDGRLPELSIELSGGGWVHSFMTAEGQPEWTVFLPGGSWLCVEAGRLVHDRQNVRRRAELRPNPRMQPTGRSGRGRPRGRLPP